MTPSASPSSAKPADQLRIEPPERSFPSTPSPSNLLHISTLLQSLVTKFRSYELKSIQMIEYERAIISLEPAQVDSLRASLNSEQVEIYRMLRNLSAAFYLRSRY